jgi:multiple antibiotic resistance protein
VSFYDFVKVFIAFFVIMDPFQGVPVFIILTKNFKRKDIVRNANSSILVAAILFFLFLFFGFFILDFMSISMSSFRIAGGLVLLIMGVTYVLSIKLHSEETRSISKDITIPMAVPMITGPGMITLAILFSREYGILIPLIAAVVCFLIYWVCLMKSEVIHAFLGRQGTEVLSKVMGLFLAAIAAQMIIAGLREVIGGAV